MIGRIGGGLRGVTRLENLRVNSGKRVNQVGGILCLLVEPIDSRSRQTALETSGKVRVLIEMTWESTLEGDVWKHQTLKLLLLKGHVDERSLNRKLDEDRALDFTFVPHRR